MSVQIRETLAYKATRDGLVSALAIAEEAFTNATFSYDPNSNYRKAKAVIDAILLQMRALAVSTLKSIDQTIADSDLVKGLNKKAADAKRSADEIAKAAHTIDDIAGVVTKITSIVTGIAGLPFL